MKLTVDRTNFYIRKMTKADAETVCGWRYCGPQEIYNTENSPESVRSFLDGLHFAVSRTFGGKISAFIALGEKAALPLPELAHIYEDESYTDFALGLAPEECGKKQGEKYVKAAMELCKRCFPGDGFRVTVGRETPPR